MCCAKVHRKKTDKRIAVSIIAIPETHANPSTTCLFPFINSHIYLNNHFLTTFSYIRIIFLFSFFFWSIRREKIKVVIKIVIYDCINKLFIFLTLFSVVPTSISLCSFVVSFLDPISFVIITVLNININNNQTYSFRCFSRKLVPAD